MNGRRLAPTEKQIETSILNILRWKGVFAFKVENGGVYDHHRGVYRFNSALRLRGIADLIGVYRGKALAIEVKTATGKVSEHQERFLADWRAAGGVAIVARPIDDVLDLIAQLDHA